MPLEGPAHAPLSTQQGNPWVADPVPHRLTGHLPMARLHSGRMLVLVASRARDHHSVDGPPFGAQRAVRQLFGHPSLRGLHQVGQVLLHLL
eukprot:817715-Lingulodinium_polyedra.AAC.1